MSRRWRSFGFALLVVTTTSCGEGSSRQLVAAPSMPTAVVDELKLPALVEADRIVIERHPEEAMALARSGSEIDANGLIGRNRKYGKLISPRLQLGAGAALRVGLHTDRTMALNGFRAIEAATVAINPDGEVVSEIPPDAPAGAALTPGDNASAAAFFLADACPAMLALSEHPNSATIIEPIRQRRVKEALSRAIGWLIGQAAALEAVDRRAPNRLLYDALAYQSCGALVGNDAATSMSARFVGQALAQTRDDGMLVERGGSDTTYQAVSVRLALDLLVTGYSGSDAVRLNAAWQRGAIWLGNRIGQDGRIDSSANTRTCKGGEQFLGTDKKVWPPGVYGALIYAAELVPHEGVGAAAARLSKWAQANPKTDPCFP